MFICGTTSSLKTLLLFTPINRLYQPVKLIETVHHLERISLTVHQDYFFTMERDDEENPVVVKYRSTNINCCKITGVCKKK